MFCTSHTKIPLFKILQQIKFSQVCLTKANTHNTTKTLKGHPHDMSLKTKKISEYFAIAGQEPGDSRKLLKSHDVLLMSSYNRINNAEDDGYLQSYKSSYHHYKMAVVHYELYVVSEMQLHH